jgi:radical SAM superfamily enzyme YgiQ (UPF0313 family)
MRIVFVNPPFRFRISRASRWPEHTKSGTLYYPFWLAYAAGYAEQAGHEVLLLDAIPNGWSNEETIRRILEFRPSLVVMDTSLPSIKSDAEFAAKLKSVNINVKICLVGTFPSARPEYVMGLSDAIDFVARKEYDVTIADLANALDKTGDASTVLGITHRKNGSIIGTPDRMPMDDLDVLPFVSKVYKKFLNPQHYRYALARHPMIQIMSARGCPSQCVFCNVPQTFMSRSFRMRSAANLVDEMRWIKENMPEIKEIFIEDDTMTVNKDRILEICRLIKERGLKVVWSANARTDIPRDVLKEMKEAGCRMLIVGYESGNQQILNNVKKGITIEQAEKFTKDAKEVGIKIFGCFMIGLPGDTRETIRETIDWAKRLKPDMIQIEQIVPFPGTEFYDWAKQNGYLKSEDPDAWLDETGQLGYLIDYPDLPSEELRKMRDKLTLEFYTDPRQMFRILANNLHPREFARLVKASWDYFKYLLNKK